MTESGVGLSPSWSIVDCEEEVVNDPPDVVIWGCWLDGGSGEGEAEDAGGQKHVREEAGKEAHFSETYNEVFDLRGESLCKKRRANMRRKGGGIKTKRERRGRFIASSWLAAG